jgi:hypothetical protein
VILTGPTILVGPKLAHHLERVVHNEAEKARRNGYVLPDEVVELLGDLRRLAAIYRARVSDAGDADVTRDSDVPAPRATLDSLGIADLAGVSDHGVREAARRGRLPGRKVGGRWVFEEVDALAWLTSRRNGRHDDG